MEWLKIKDHVWLIDAKSYKLSKHEIWLAINESLRFVFNANCRSICGSVVDGGVGEVGEYVNMTGRNNEDWGIFVIVWTAMKYFNELTLFVYWTTVGLLVVETLR